MRGHRGELRPSRPALAAAGLAAVVAGISGLVFSGARDDRASARTERTRLLTVLRAGRTALLADDGPRACALLSDHGRRQALQFRLYYLIDGSNTPRDRRRGIPSTCPEVVEFLWQDDHQPYVSPSWLPALRADDFRIREITSTRAVVDLVAPGQAVGTRPAATIDLAKTGSNWKVDDANIVPEGD